MGGACGDHRIGGPLRPSRLASRRSSSPWSPCWRWPTRPGPKRSTLDGLARAWIDIAYVGLLSSALTFTLLTVALQYTPPSEVAVIVSLETVFAAVAAYLVLGERLGTLGWVGAT